MRSTPTLRRMLIRLLLAATLLGVTACSVATPFATPAAAASPASRSQTQAWLSYVACLRQHGADVPDPTFDQDGNPRWSVNPKNVSEAASQACASRLPAAGLSRKRPGPPSAADLAKETQFARCMRQHGIPDFPDPDPQTGSFDTSGANVKSSAAGQAALQACNQFGPNGR